jgi:hypothetical protein
LHQLSHLQLDTMSIKNGLSSWEEPGELSKIKTSNCLYLVFDSFFEQLVSQDADQTEVVRSVKVDEVLLPKLFGMAWSPSELPSNNLILQLINRAENFLVLIKELKHGVNQLVDVLVNPMSVFELDDDRQAIDIG